MPDINARNTQTNYLFGDRTKWYGQNGMDKMVAIFIDSKSNELNF